MRAGKYYFSLFVAPLVGAWIEIGWRVSDTAVCGVAPLVGAWIEINLIPKYTGWGMSLPSWERGLKLAREIVKNDGIEVAPLVGAWIEILFEISELWVCTVAPLVGAWIEIPSPKASESIKTGRSPRGSVD